MKDVFLVLAMVVIWVLLQKVILPWFGIPTCMSGSCDLAGRDAVRGKINSNAAQEGTQDKPVK